MLINSLIRYPGSKAKLHKAISSVLPESAQMPLMMHKLDCYCEPFLGSGVIAWTVLGSIGKYRNQSIKVILGDRDLYIARLWQVVRDEPVELNDMIRNATPEVSDFEKFRSLDGAENVDARVSALRKIMLHQLSWSGLGFKAGSVLGGKNQRSEFNYLCRWNPSKLTDKVANIHGIMNRFSNLEIYHSDFEDTLSQVPASGLAYLDPPYYKQGKALYRYHMEDADHVRLANVLQRARYRFVLSYDDHPRIRELYSWAKIDSFEMTPTIQETKTPRRKNNELLITNP